MSRLVAQVGAPGSGMVQFPSLGTYAHLSTRDPAELSTATLISTAILTEIDETCSRFRDESDLSQVNRCAGSWVETDPLLVCAVRAACSAAQQTGGLVHPLLGAPLAQVGYDRDFGLLGLSRDEETPTLLGHGPELQSWRQIEWDEAGAIRIPVDTALDLGSTAKAFAADLIAAALQEEISGGALISLGGDIAIALPHDPQTAHAQPWPIAISERPAEPAEQVVTLDSGGLATSSTQVRHWRHQGVRRHHLLDPRTGLPCPEIWRTVTATGVTCLAANIASTAAIVLGLAAPAWLANRGVDARLVAANGDVTTTGNWPRKEGQT